MESSEKKMTELSPWTLAVTRHYSKTNLIPNNMPVETMRATLSPHSEHEYTVQCQCNCHKPPLLPPDFVLGGKGSPQVPWSRHNSPRTKGSATVTWENDGTGATKVWWSRHTRGKTGGGWKKPETVKRWTETFVCTDFPLSTSLHGSLLVASHSCIV